MYLFLILLIPLSWPWISKYIWPHEITYKEIALHIVIVLFITIGFYYVVMIGKTLDTEIWNGKVISKKSHRVPCIHSYECNCRYITSGSGKNKTRTRVCDTCYEHLFDVDWTVYSDISESVDIDRIDRQGIYEPPRFTKVKIGEPFSASKTFVNYIKAQPDSLFNNKGLVNKYKDVLPDYPEIYDYYKINRVITVNYNMPNKKQWNDKLNMIMRVLGKKRHSNIVMVITNQSSRDYALALKDYWLGGKKNDTVIVIGSNNFPEIDWVEVFSWSSDKYLDINLRDKLSKITLLDVNKGVSIINDEIDNHFKKLSMETYKYLEETAIPSIGVIIFTAIVSLLVSIVTSYITYKHNIFN